MTIRTARLIPRPWRDSDLPLFAAQNADPEVMRFLNGPLTAVESDAWAARSRRDLATHGFCIWAVEAPGIAPPIGAAGLGRLTFEASFTPAVEVLWRLNRPWWSRGYATEAARAAVADGFARVGLPEIVAIASLRNLPSQRVMERLGFVRSCEFDHPRPEAGNPLRRHILYRQTREQWEETRTWP